MDTKNNPSFLSKTMLAAETISKALEKTFFNASSEPETLPLFKPDPINPSGRWIAAFSLEKEAA